jgi:hypothetical protein
LKSKAGRIGWIVLALAALIPMAMWECDFAQRIARERDFYGMLAVSDSKDEDTHETMRSFISGGTVHGRQNRTPGKLRDPLTYYGRKTGVGIALEHFKAKTNARVGVIGMGAGTVAAYAEAGQTYRFYEINPTAVKLALNYFTFVSDLQARGGKYELALGDARLMLEHEAPQKFDVMLLDAFSGDSVPVHLLTAEAFKLYLQHLEPNGIIAVHITNHYLNLAPVVERAAKEFGLKSIRIADDGEADGCYATDYLLLTRDGDFVAKTPPVMPDYAKSIDVPLWTDHRTNLFQILQRR